MQQIIEHLPLWLVIVILGYFAVMLTIAILRGQAVQFFPPKIGERRPHTDGLILSGWSNLNQKNSNSLLGILKVFGVTGSCMTPMLGPRLYGLDIHQRVTMSVVGISEQIVH
jgi:hypothetical protein